ncbi:hypothetical protein PSP6_750009 [Paraburkholderia tropica]|uniref:hypothetical protein n=1 Tax=Paraburkholderia tropica TaxID=92647 RepID=UPI001CAC66BA|nr:hypothetical protein [Paraburkholderia tropica]CAG9237776.1 hypothetical protein PSP6_750009 [Paraburkholderia tropica]
MQNQFAISMPLHPFVAVVIHTQFPPPALARFATTGDAGSVSAADRNVINRFLSGLGQNRLELIGPHSSLVASNVIAHLRDFTTPAGLEPYLDDMSFFSPAERAEWAAMTDAQRLAFYEGAKAVGEHASEAWADLTRNDD